MSNISARPPDDRPIFHLAFPIATISQAKEFYVQGLGCTLGRETKNSIILGLYGHQLVGHITDIPLTTQRGIYPRHFGIVFPHLDMWQELEQRATAQQLIYRQPAKQRFRDEVTEHYAFFLEDPFYNLLEFKYYVQPEAVLGAQNFDLIGDR
jgi:uncharacterized protein